jgi:hypothetical protein
MGHELRSRRERDHREAALAQTAAHESLELVADETRQRPSGAVLFDGVVERAPRKPRKPTNRGK